MEGGGRFSAKKTKKSGRLVKMSEVKEKKSCSKQEID